MTSSTRFRSFSRTGAVPLTTCDTVPMETCARSAICFIVVGLVIDGESATFRPLGPFFSRAASWCESSRNSLPVFDAAESQCSGTIHAGRHHQEFTVFCQFICLGEIPDGALRTVIASASQNSGACVPIEKLICPLPHVANQVHHSEGAGSFWMRGNGSGPAHHAALVPTGDRRSIPLVSPRIQAAVGACGGVLPLPFVWQALARPGGVDARIFERNPGDRLVCRTRGVGAIPPVAQEIQVILGLIVRGVQKLFELGVGYRVFVHPEGLYVNDVLMISARGVFPRVLDVDADVV